MSFAGPVQLGVEPIRVELDVYIEVPSVSDLSGRVSRWSQLHHGVDRLPSFIEGPVLDEHGSLYLVDIAWGRIIKVRPDREVSILAEYDGQPNGLAIGSDGRLYIADHLHGLLVLEDLDQPGDVAPVLTSFGDQPFKGLNDLVLGPHGALYFTDQGSTGLHDPSGRVFALDVDRGPRVLIDNVPSPNGIAVDSAGTTMFVAVTRDNSVWRLPLLAFGGVTKAGRYVQLSGGTGPDGLCLCTDGSLLVAHLGLGVVWVFDPAGIPIGYLQAPRGLATTNVTMNPATSRVFVTESMTGCVLTADLTKLLGTGR